MIFCKFFRCVSAMFFMAILTGCTNIISQEHNYQLKTNLTDLEANDEFKEIPFSSKPSGGMAVSSSSYAERIVPEPTPNSLQQVSRQRQATDHQSDAQAIATDESTTKLLTKDATVGSLVIDQDKNQAWRLVSRSLSRQSIEIVERNLDKSYFYVEYDPKARKLAYKTYWDELLFLFSGDPSNEIKYRISLLQIEPQSTEITVQDTKGKTLSNGPSSSLLKLITNGINQETITGNAENTDSNRHLFSHEDI